MTWATIIPNGSTLYCLGDPIWLILWPVLVIFACWLVTRDFKEFRWK